MQITPKKGQWCWWLAVLAVAVILKHHYSTATALELNWILRPLALLLEWFSRHSFLPNSNHEWLSLSANVILVKSCAGINFMIMSFVVYTWLFKPEKQRGQPFYLMLTSLLLLLLAALIAAWATTLFANTLRILLAMAAIENSWEFPLIGIGAKQLHRLIGMVVYLPTLSLQMLLGRATSKTPLVLLVPASLYLLLMVVVPLLTGNAFHHLSLFWEHLFFCLIPLLVVGLALLAKQLLTRGVELAR